MKTFVIYLFYTCGIIIFMKTKIIIFSDSHGYASNMIDAIEKEKPHYCIHLGDGERDLETVSFVYPNLIIYNVRGNCDGWSSTPAEDVYTIAGKRIYAVHGNLHRVKRNDLSPELEADALKCEADIVLFGHTHNAIYLCRSGMEIINPGTIKNDSNASYAVICIENGKTGIEIKYITQ